MMAQVRTRESDRVGLGPIDEHGDIVWDQVTAFGYGREGWLRREGLPRRHGAGRRYGEVAQASNRPFFVVRRPGCGSSVATRVDEVTREDGRTAVDPLLRHGIEGINKTPTISDNPLAC